jgi:arsenic resistance protein ArsH
MIDTPNIEEAHFKPISFDGPPPNVLLLYGSLRDVSYSRAAAEECAAILQKFGAVTEMFDPRGLPLPEAEDASHNMVAELREKVTACDGMVWVSPERHGAMTGIMKAQIDWIPLSLGGVRPTQGKTLAIGQVNGGSQSFNTVNQLRILGRWMRMITIPNQFSTPKAWLEFEKGRMTPSPFYNRMVDVMEELIRFTVLTRDIREQLVDRYSERVETAEALSKRVNKK